MLLNARGEGAAGGEGAVPHEMIERSTVEAGAILRGREGCTAGGREGGREGGSEEEKEEWRKGSEGSREEGRRGRTNSSTNLRSSQANQKETWLRRSPR